MPSKIFIKLYKLTFSTEMVLNASFKCNMGARTTHPQTTRPHLSKSLLVRQLVPTNSLFRQLVPFSKNVLLSDNLSLKCHFPRIQMVKRKIFLNIKQKMVGSQCQNFFQKGLGLLFKKLVGIS